eukprot:TRINITY_DN2842_c0_g1_i1.p1 TRINITY_DN2842_c0_g1~~TRINITY_DN2842_c0_g1_i1.p1  ORF type:complete len:179 (-),score=6.14 TRINITY_DN2842_c0_g1_i1:62-598(-)
MFVRGFCLLFLFAVLALGDNCRCVFKQGASLDLKLAALEYLCGVMDCSPISPNGLFYYPDTIEAHAAWAINVWFQKYRTSASCNFKNSAEVLCQNCTCALNSTGVTDQQLSDAIGFVCSQPNFDCAPIRPGGDNFEPDTLENHAQWVVNTWYQQYLWVPDSCSFGGIASPQPKSCQGR